MYRKGWLAKKEKLNYPNTPSPKKGVSFKKRFIPTDEAFHKVLKDIFELKKELKRNKIDG